MVKYVAHPFYLGRPEMGRATEAAWCAQDQGKFFEYQHILFENQGLIAYDVASLVQLATEVGLDVPAFNQCLTGGVHRADVENARQAAFNRGVNATPTFFINNTRIEGNVPYERFKEVFDREIARAQ